MNSEGKKDKLLKFSELFGRELDEETTDAILDEFYEETNGLGKGKIDKEKFIQIC